jgi:RNA polymerase sigma-70 factor, ECF subfamily
MDEAKLVRRARRGDREAFAALVKLHERSLYGTAYGITRSEWDAADAVQEALAEAYSKISRLRDPERFGAWLTRILVNKCNDGFRVRKPLICVAEPPEPGQPHLYVGAEEGLDLMAAVQQLDSDHRMVVTLRYFRDMKIDDIAEVLGCPAGTVKSRLNRALARLNGTLSGTESAPGSEAATRLEVAQ